MHVWGINQRRILLSLVLKWWSYRISSYFYSGNYFIQGSISVVDGFEVSLLLDVMSRRQNPMRRYVSRGASRYRSLPPLLLNIGLLIMVLLFTIIHLFLPLSFNTNKLFPFQLLYLDHVVRTIIYWMGIFFWFNSGKYRIIILFSCFL